MPPSKQPKIKQPQKLSGRPEIIRTVQTPLGFFVLVVLVVEALLAVVASMSAGPDRTLLVRGMLLLIFVLVALVTGMAVLRPESLQGSRPPVRERTDGAAAVSVARVEKPRVLCAATPMFEDLGFSDDVEVISRYFSAVQVEHRITASRIRAVLTRNRFDILHLLGFVEPASGTLRFEDAEALSSEGFAELVEVCAAKLVVLASCDSIDLAARVSRKSNIIAATTSMEVAAFAAWAECFYSLLAHGHSLSRAHDVARLTTNAPLVLLMKQDLVFV